MKNVFHERLKKLRLEKEISQAKIAVIFKISQQTYSFWELGKFEPDIETIKAIAGFFDVSVDYLVGASNSFN